MKEYFIKFPDKYIRNNIETSFCISKKFYVVYFLIDKYASREGYSWLTVKKVLDICGYKYFKHKPKAFGEIIDVLKYMESENMISVKQNLNSVDYDTAIEVEIHKEKFYGDTEFGIVTNCQINNLLYCETPVNRESLIMVFLYINSYIYCRPRKPSEEPAAANEELQPEAFWRSIEHIAKDLSMSKKTVMQCISELTTSTEEKAALLTKNEAAPTMHKASKLFPTIYVLNKPGYQNEINLAIAKIENYLNEHSKKENI